MFTGLVEAAGRVTLFEENEKGFQMDVEVPTELRDAQLGDSIAVNGCCLTVARMSEDTVSFDLLAESVRRTSFNGLSKGRLVNLERSLLPTTRMGGHFVSGHVDDTGAVDVFEKRGADHYLKVTCKPEGLAYLVEKGSIAVDGISLTVAEVHSDGFAVWLIQHTLTETNLRDRAAGEQVNLEFDLLAKYVERMVVARTGGKS